MPDEVVALITADGLKLTGSWWRTSARPRAVVVIAHGFAASTEDGEVRALALDLQGAGFDVLAYDSRGHGGSEGSCTIGDRERLDVAAAMAAAGPAPVVMIGISMGAIAMLGHAGERSIDGGSGRGARLVGLVLVSSPARWRMAPSPMALGVLVLTRTRMGRWFLARRVKVRLQRGWTLGASPLSLVASTTVPVAVIHGARDRLISPREARLLFGQIPGRRHLAIVAGMGHGLGAQARRSVLGAVEWMAPERVVAAV